MSKKTPFYDIYEKFNAKIVEFADFLMPVQFEGIISEHNTVRSSVGVFDVSHMGEIEIHGKDRFAFVNYITTNDVSQLKNNQIQYSTMLYDDAGIVDDLLVYNLSDRILLVVNAACVDKDYAWVKEHKKYDVTIHNMSDTIGQLAVQGPLSEKVIQKVTSFDVSTLAYYWATETQMGSIPVLLSRTGYTGEDGFEIYVDRTYARDLWDMIFDAGAEFQVKPIGLGARDTLRLEMRYCLYGSDIDKTTNPLEAGLRWIVAFDKGDFIGREALLAIKEKGVSRRLVGFMVIGRGVPRSHQEIHVNGTQIGYVTSGTFSPSLKKGLGMGYAAKPHDKIGSKLSVVGRHPVEVEIIKGAFYKKGSHK